MTGRESNGRLQRRSVDRSIASSGVPSTNHQPGIQLACCPITALVAHKKTEDSSPRFLAWIEENRLTSTEQGNRHGAGGQE